MASSVEYRRTPTLSLSLAVAAGLAMTGIGWATGLIDFGRTGSRAGLPPPSEIAECNREAALATERPGSGAGDGGGGTLQGVSLDNAEVEPARAAYRACMANRGFTG
jgi:hypothetical protein